MRRARVNKPSRPLYKLPRRLSHRRRRGGARAASCACCAALGSRQWLVACEGFWVPCRMESGHCADQHRNCVKGGIGLATGLGACARGGQLGRKVFAALTRLAVPQLALDLCINTLRLERRGFIVDDSIVPLVGGERTTIDGASTCSLVSRQRTCLARAGSCRWHAKCSSVATWLGCNSAAHSRRIASPRFASDWARGSPRLVWSKWWCW